MHFTSVAFGMAHDFFFLKESRMETLTRLHMVFLHLPIIMAPQNFTF
jgi:hypothetical protein